MGETEVKVEHLVAKINGAEFRLPETRQGSNATSCRSSVVCDELAQSRTGVTTHQSARADVAVHQLAI
jgi:hypothetical protein